MEGKPLVQEERPFSIEKGRSCCRGAVRAGLADDELADEGRRREDRT